MLGAHAGFGPFSKNELHWFPNRKAGPWVGIERNVRRQPNETNLAEWALGVKTKQQKQLREYAQAIVRSLIYYHNALLSILFRPHFEMFFFFCWRREHSIFVVYFLVFILRCSHFTFLTNVAVACTISIYQAFIKYTLSILYQVFLFFRLLIQ